MQISVLQSFDGKFSNFNWFKDFSIGSVHMGKVKEIKESGVVLGFEKYGNIVGFVSQHQCKIFLFNLLNDVFCNIPLSKWSYVP